MKWFLIAAFLAGTLAAVSAADSCKADEDCPSDNCCGAQKIIHMMGKGVCMPIAKNNQKCSEEKILERYPMYCGCAEGLECKSGNPKLDKARDTSKYIASLKCRQPDEKPEPQPKTEAPEPPEPQPKTDAPEPPDPEPEVEAPKKPEPEAPIGIGNGPGGEPPRDDDCADWIYPC